MSIKCESSKKANKQGEFSLPPTDPETGGDVPGITDPLRRTGVNFNLNSARTLVRSDSKTYQNKRLAEFMLIRALVRASNPAIFPRLFGHALFA